MNMCTIGVRVKVRLLHAKSRHWSTVLLAQLADILQGYALPKSWADPLMTMLEEDEKSRPSKALACLSLMRETRLVTCRASYSDT